jgi:hypothetical protein
MWVGGVVVGLIVVAFSVVAYVAHNAEPILRKKVIATLEARFHSPVDLDALHISLARGLEVSGSGLRILYLAGPDEPDVRPAGAPPMLSVQSFQFHTGLRQIFEPTLRVVEVRVQGMQLDIPPKQERGAIFGKGKTEDNSQRKGQPRIGVLIDKIVCSDVTLTIETNQPGKAPLVFDIRDLTLRDVGDKKPFVFEASLVNAKPVGDIRSTGHFGPWQDDAPRDTPVDGEYSFTNADLGTIKGIGGTLSSTGRYGGTLGEIGVTGTTETPDFSVDVSEHPVDLKTEFDATVDGTSGDTRLNSVRATLWNTVLQVKGMVRRASDMEPEPGAMPQKSGDDVQGHFIDISVESSQARVEDILTLAVKTSPPLMQGGMTLKAHLTIPPGKVSISKKVKVEGTFAIRGATFSNAKWQETVDKLSMRASGDLKEEGAEDAKLVTSQMSGSFALADALLHVSGLHYQMPGAQVDLAGRYSLDGQTFDFDGTVRTKATASEMLKGWKSWVAKPFDPLFKKDGAGLEVPITISGTKADPKVGLDLGKMLSRHKDEGQQGPGAHP